MCGLVAIINKNTNGTTQEQNEVFSTLLFLDLLRGADSTGVMCIENNGDLSLAKEAVDSLAFIRTKEYQSLLTKAYKSGSALIGHNRKATRGVINDENAHPFVVDDNIVLVHNGTMYGDHKKHADTEVDSHAIAHVIHETGDVEAALNKIDAAYALIWYNVKEGTLNFVRNTSRPLWWMETHNAWYFCSEKEMLDFAAKRHKLNLKEQPAELPHDLLQTFKLRNNGGWESDNKKIKIESKYQYQGNNSMGKYYPGASAWAMPGADDDGIVEAHVKQHAASARPAPPVQSPSGGGIPFSMQERLLVKRMNKWTTHGEFEDLVLSQYHGGMKIAAEPFDYLESPNKDGWLLYSSILDNPEVVVKHFFSKSHTTEERILQLASGDYIFEFMINQMQWIPFEEKSGNPIFLKDDMGYTMFNSGRATMVYGGGIGSKEAVEEVVKKSKVKLVH